VLDRYLKYRIVKRELRTSLGSPLFLNQHLIYVSFASYMDQESSKKKGTRPRTRGRPRKEVKDAPLEDVRDHTRHTTKL
jgi:hypothetical protein